MKQTRPLRKLAAVPALPGLLLTLAACASGQTAAPQVATAPLQGRSVAIRSSGYDAPEMGAVSALALRSKAAKAHSTAQPAAEDGTDAVPAPTKAARLAPTLAVLPDLDAIVVTRDEPVRTAQVYEGETRSIMPERLERQTPRPPATAEPIREAVPASPSRTAGRSALHLASYRAAEQAAEGWGVLTDDYPDVLSDLMPGRTTIDVPGRGEFVRLLAGPLTDDEAETACDTLSERGAYCAVVDWTPDEF